MIKTLRMTTLILSESVPTLNLRASRTVAILHHILTLHQDAMPNFHETKAEPPKLQVSLATILREYPLTEFSQA